MIYILQIETSTSMCSVAISMDGSTVSCVEKNESNIHAEQLLPMIDKALVDAAITIKDLKAICVSKGPGSYTGLRIGVASAKGLCYGLELPLISIPTLQAFAFNESGKININNKEKIVFCPMIDARRMEVYTARFDAEINYVMKESADILDDEYFDKLDKSYDYYFFGNGAEKAVNIIMERKNMQLLNDCWPSAEGMSHLAFAAYKSNSFEDIAYYEPYYLKDFIATTPKKNILRKG